MIKVGDWVKCQVTEDYAEIHRVAEIKEKMIGGEKVNYCFNSQGLSFFESELVKLPIKFKGFIVLKEGEINETRFIKATGKMYHFSATPSKSSTLIRVFIRLFVDGNWAYVVNSCSKNTIDQAKDWLELQYATMIAKTRNLI